MHAADCEFACKADTEAMFLACSHVQVGQMKCTLGFKREQMEEGLQVFPNKRMPIWEGR
ncbi:MAG: hypothetical protein JSU77_13700 [Fidelibacterota bacterium]|nr:MAG: hypothetical protein JSU77_13700 [Candidatus Neomarinimicrobiota bacterium]